MKMADETMMQEEARARRLPWRWCGTRRQRPGRHGEWCHMTEGAGRSQTATAVVCMGMGTGM